MIAVPTELAAALNAPANQPVDLYELYLDSTTLYLAAEDVTWNGHLYVGKITDRSAITRYINGQFDTVTVTCENVDTTLAQVLLENGVEGRRLVIRKIDRSVAGQSIVLFDGRMLPPSVITETEAQIVANQALGSIAFDVPTRTFGTGCPFPFKGPECGYAGDETACDQSWARCNALANTNRFGGFRFVPASGTFQISAPLLGGAVFTRTWQKYDETPYDTPIPIVYGRVQMTGMVVQYEANTNNIGAGNAVALAVFCIGPIYSIIQITVDGQQTAWNAHLGEIGGSGTQLVDSRFPSGYPYNLVAYAGVSAAAKSDGTGPDVVGVIAGRLVRRFDDEGTLAATEWSDNPVWIVRDFLTLSLAQGGMGLPDSLMDDVENYKTAAYCNELIDNPTNDQAIYPAAGTIPGADAPAQFQSTGVDGNDPTVAGPYVDYAVDDDTLTPTVLQVKRFTLNVAITERDKAIDVLYKKLLPAFRGYMAQSAEGKLQIRCERPVKNCVSTASAAAGQAAIAVADPSQWSIGDMVLIEPLTVRAEVRKISAVGSTTVTFGAALGFTHGSGSTMMQVMMALDKSNIVRDLQYPLTADQETQPSTNRITVKYVDAPSGFVPTELRVNDYDHQALVHNINSEDLDGSGIDSYFQAWRIGQWALSKRLDSAKFCSLTADIKATLLEVGDVFAVSAAEVGLQCVPFMVQQTAPAENDEVALLGQIYSIDAYTDAAPRHTANVPGVFTAPAMRDRYARHPTPLSEPVPNRVAPNLASGADYQVVTIAANGITIVNPVNPRAGIWWLILEFTVPDLDAPQFADGYLGDLSSILPAGYVPPFQLQIMLNYDPYRHLSVVLGVYGGVTLPS